MNEHELLNIIKEKYKKLPIFSKIEEIKEFKKLFNERLVIYGHYYYKNDRPKIDFEIENSIQFLILLATNFGFYSDDLLRSLKGFLLISYHLENHKSKLTNYLTNKKDNKYLTHWESLNKCINPIINTLYNADINELNSENKYFKNKEIAENWIKKHTLETLILKMIPNPKPIEIPKLRKLIDTYVTVFVMRFTKMERLIHKNQQKVWMEIAKLSVHHARKKDIDINDFDELVGDSYQIVIQKLEDFDFEMRTSIKNLWEGVFFNLRSQFFRKEKITKKLELYYEKGSYDFFDNYPNELFKKEEFLEFVAQGLTSIKEFMNGNAITLLLTGRRSDFTKIIMDTFNNSIEKEKMNKFEYKIEVASTLRNKCKIKLIETLREMAEKDNKQRLMYDFLMKYE
jgi:hypothetical protein